jgi:hypothetical protein
MMSPPEIKMENVLEHSQFPVLHISPPLLVKQLFGVYAHAFFRFSESLETDDAIDKGIKRVIPTLSDVHAGVDPRAALADDDRTRVNGISGVSLDTQPVRLTVTPVLRTPDSLFVRHGGSTPRCSYAVISLILKRV